MLKYRVTKVSYKTSSIGTTYPCQKREYLERL